MTDVSTALRYARALLEVAREGNALPAIEADLQALEKILSEAPEIRQFCLDSRSAVDVRLEFVEIAFCPYVHEITQRLLRLTAANDRLGIIPHLPEAWQRLRREEHDIEQIVLETVRPADDDLKTRVSDRLQQRLGRKIEIVQRLNPDLLGGFRIFWGDRLLDNSASARARALGRRLMARPVK